MLVCKPTASNAQARTHRRNVWLFALSLYKHRRLHCIIRSHISNETFAIYFFHRGSESKFRYSWSAILQSSRIHRDLFSLRRQFALRIICGHIIHAHDSVESIKTRAHHSEKYGWAERARFRGVGEFVRERARRQCDGGNV